MSAFDNYRAEAAPLAEVGSETGPQDARERDARSARRIARTLGRGLTPVVLDLGASQPRFGSYLEWDEEQGTALLVPVAGEALSLALAGASGTIRIRSTDPAQPWMLIARSIRVATDRMAVVELARTDAVRMPERVPGRTQARGREPLVLAVHPGTGAIESHVFPITSLGAEHCLIDATLPLERGQTLGPVEVIGERRILRCATARVIEVIPWVTAHGDRRFRCRLAFEEATAPAVIDQGHDLMSDAKRIGRLFELASMIELSGWYDAPGWPRARMRIGEFHVNDGLLTIAAAEVPPPAAIPLPGEVRIGFELFGVSYEGWVRLHRRRGSRFEVALPFVMRRRRRRREQRAVLDRTWGVNLEFRSSATGECLSRPILDLSFGGVCIEAEPIDLLWRGARLEEARIVWPEGDVPLGDVEVRSVVRTSGNGIRCHLANRGVTQSDSPALINLLASSYHPEAERHDGTDFQSMLTFYEKAGLLGEFTLRNLRQVLPEAAVVWRKLHDREGSVACTLVFRGGPSREPQAAFSGVRVWEKTWLVQHFGALGTADRRATGTLQLASLDFVMPQRETHYLAFFVRAENAGMNAFLQKFLRLTGTPEAVARVAVTRWLLRGDRPPSPGGGVQAAPSAAGQARPAPALRPISHSDEVVVSRAAERTLGVMAANALSLLPGAFSLPATSGRFARLGLARDRQAWVITEAGGAIDAALLKESASPGINLTWMLDAWWYLPVESYRTGDTCSVAVAAAAVADAPTEVAHCDKLFVVPEGTPAGPLLAAGFEKLADLNLYVINRSGFRRYHEYIADRYGELSAKMIKRSAGKVARSAS
jgi:hypothetical protein